MNSFRRQLFTVGQPNQRSPLGIPDFIILLALGVMIYIGVRVAVASPQPINGPDINLDPQMLPYYTALSVGRMFFAYILSLIFSLVYGYAAARNPSAERVMLPILDVLQSIPI